MLLNNSSIGFPGGSDGKASVCSAGDLDSIPGLGRSLEKGMATHSSPLVWKILWMEKSSRLQPVGSQRVGYDWATSFFTIVLLIIVPLMIPTSYWMFFCLSKTLTQIISDPHNNHTSSQFNIQVKCLIWRSFFFLHDAIFLILQMVKKHGEYLCKSYHFPLVSSTFPSPNHCISFLPCQNIFFGHFIPLVLTIALICTWTLPNSYFSTQMK